MTAVLAVSPTPLLRAKNSTFSAALPRCNGTYRSLALCITVSSLTIASSNDSLEPEPEPAISFAFSLNTLLAPAALLTRS